MQDTRDMPCHSAEEDGDVRPAEVLNGRRHSKITKLICQNSDKAKEQG